MDVDINTISALSSTANDEIRCLKNDQLIYPERCDVMYAIFIFVDGCKLKIGRTTVAGFDRRMKEHASTWSGSCMSLVTVRKIIHWTEEEKFHKYMRTFSNGMYRRVVKAMGKTFDEFYENDPIVLEELYRFIG
jgi:hypothetical protein